MIADFIIGLLCFIIMLLFANLYYLRAIDNAYIKKIKDLENKQETNRYMYKEMERIYRLWLLKKQEEAEYEYWYNNNKFISRRYK